MFYAERSRDRISEAAIASGAFLHSRKNLQMNRALRIGLITGAVVFGVGLGFAVAVAPLALGALVLGMGGASGTATALAESALLFVASPLAFGFAGHNAMKGIGQLTENL